MGGRNQGKTYPCNDPCPEGYYFDVLDCNCILKGGSGCPHGVSGVLTSHITYLKGGYSQITTFYPSLWGGIPEGATRIVKGDIQVFDGNTFISAATAPVNRGDIYDGREVSHVKHWLNLASHCN